MSHFLYSLIRWFDSEAGPEELTSYEGKGTDWARIVPLIGLHLGCLAVVWVGWSAIAVIVAIGLYVLRMFAITGFYHRYFSHNAFRASRFWTLVFAVLGNTAVQRGPLWWASHHRHHHRYADTEHDVHSPARQGFFWWEIDVTYYVLVLMSWLGILKDLGPVPSVVRERNLVAEQR